MLRFRLIAIEFINGIPGGHNSNTHWKDLIDPSVIEVPASNIIVLSRPPIFGIA
jgi:hypothetical protein